MKQPEPRLRLVFTLQLHVAVGAGALRLRWQRIHGGAAGAILWVGPVGMGAHVIAKDASQDPPVGERGLAVTGPATSTNDVTTTDRTGPSPARADR